MRLRLLFVLLIFSVSPSWADSVSCDLARDAIKAASRIRGLAQKSSVPCYLRTQEEVKKFLLDSIEKKIPRTRIEGEGIFYKAIGFVPKDFDYVQGLIDLYLSQLGGYYDPEENYYVMAAWLPEIMQPTIAVHELTHALQDQYFDLETFLDDKSQSTDELLARSALIEGDATAVMNDYQREFAGLPPISKENNVDALVLQTVLGSYVTQGLASAPETLKNTLLFPYISGLRFVHTFLKEGSYKKLNDIFLHPPLTTEEILHPEKYPAGKQESSPISSLEVERLGTIEHQDTMGEFFISAWLTPLLGDKGEGAQSGRGWGGDRAFVVKTASGKKEIVWIIKWDSKKEAEDFEGRGNKALGRVYAEKPGSYSISRKDLTVKLRVLF